MCSSDVYKHSEVLVLASRYLVFDVLEGKLSYIFRDVNSSETLKYRSEASCDFDSCFVRNILRSFPSHDFTDVGMTVSSLVILKFQLEQCLTLSSHFSAIYICTAFIIDFRKFST